jgi:branched-subunit amino acid transport protein
MKMFVVIALVGAGSYALRLLPLLLIDRIHLSARAESTLGDAAVAAMAALVVALVLHLGDHPSVPPASRWVGLGVGAVAATARLSMARVAVVGLAASGLTTLVMHL